MHYKDIDNEEIKEIMDDMVKLIGVYFKSEANDNYFGELYLHDVIELMKVAELRKLNKEFKDYNSKVIVEQY